jgi:hypothetical protein
MKRHMGILLSLMGAAACAGRAQLPGASEQPDAAAPRPAPDNSALTPELRSTNISLDTVLTGLNPKDVAAVCRAVGEWRFRLSPQFCLAFVQSAVIMGMPPRSEAEDRVLCADSLKICGSPPTEPTPACTSLPDTCTVTLGELDRCYADQERAWLAIPSCEMMTRALAPSTPGAPGNQPSCVKIGAACNNVL